MSAERKPRPRLPKRVFDLDLEHWPRCGGDLRIIAATEQPALIAKILTHLGLPARAPPRAPARPLALSLAASDPRRQERLCNGAEHPARPGLLWRGGRVRRSQAIRVESEG